MIHFWVITDSFVCNRPVLWLDFLKAVSFKYMYSVDLWASPRWQPCSLPDWAAVPTSLAVWASFASRLSLYPKHLSSHFGWTPSRQQDTWEETQHTAWGGSRTSPETAEKRKVSQKGLRLKHFSPSISITLSTHCLKNTLIKHWR